MQILCKFFLTFRFVNTNIVISLDTRRAKKDGSFPVVLRLGHNERTTSIQTSVSVSLKDWDEKNRCVRKSYSGTSSVNRLNNLIAKKKASAKSFSNSARINKYIQHYLGVSQKVLVGLSESNQLHLLSLSEIKSQIVVELDGSSFNVTIDEHIDKMNKERRYGNAQTYKDLKQFLVKYCGSAAVSVSDIDFKWLSDIESLYRTKGNSLNSLGVRLRALYVARK